MKIGTIKIVLLLFIGINICLGLLMIHQWPDAATHFIMCDVGQGDALLITKGFTQVLIDGGPDTAVLNCLGKHLPWWDRTIEWIVATHPDKDHINGLTSVLNRYQVSHFVMEASSKQTGSFSTLVQAALEEEERGMKWVSPSKGIRIVVDSTVILQLLSPEVGGRERGRVGKTLAEIVLSDALEENSLNSIDSNDRSIAIFAQLDGVTALLMGDTTTEGELALLDEHLIHHSNILKIGHHGAKTSSSVQLLQRVRPEISLISVGKNNQYGHPASQVLFTLSQVGSKVWRTDEMGSIEVIMKEGIYAINSERG